MLDFIYALYTLGVKVTFLPAILIPMHLHLLSSLSVNVGAKEIQPPSFGKIYEKNKVESFIVYPRLTISYNRLAISHWVTRLRPKIGQIGPKWDKSGTF